jgi:hypothetical protein
MLTFIHGEILNVGLLMRGMNEGDRVSVVERSAHLQSN